MKKDLFYRYNTKTKVYPNGDTKTVYCNRSIFSYKPTKQDFETWLTVVKPERDLSFDEQLFSTECTVEIPSDENFIGYDEQPTQKNSSSRDTTEQHIIRAKNRLFDIVYCNSWNYFLTITIDDSIVDGHNVPAVMKKVNSFLHNSVNRKGLRYVLVPEEHKSGRIHCHALVNDVFTLTDSGTRIVKNYDRPVKLSTIHRKHIPDADILRTVYNVDDWRNGYSTAIPVYGDPGAIAQYVTKYITKDCKKIFGKYFWSSRNLIREPDIFLSDTDFYSDDLSRLPEYPLIRANVVLKYDNGSAIIKS